MIIEDLFNRLQTEKTFPDFVITCGEVFSTLEDADGNIGIVAVPDVPVTHSEEALYLKRIEMQLRINARVNQPGDALCTKNLIEVIRAAQHENIVMAGFIRGVFDQLQQAGLSCRVFDLKKDDPELTPLSQMPEYLQQADIVLVTGTCFANGSLENMIELMKFNARMFIIGPSAPMSPLLFAMIPNLKGIFGSIVRSRAIIQKIKNGAGVSQLREDLRKVVLLRENYISG